MTSEGRYFLKLAHDFADDCLFLRVADLVDSTVELCQCVYIRLLTKASKNGDGSIGDVDLEEVAWYYKKPVDLIQRIVETFRRLGKIDGDQLVNWAKRQGGATVVKLADTAKKVGDQVRRVSTQRTRKYKERQRAASRQLSLLLPVSGGAGGASGTPVPRPPGTPVPDAEPTSKTGDVSTTSPRNGDAPEKESERSLETESTCSKVVPSSKTVLNDSKNDKGVSQRCALSTPAETKAKRKNLIKTLRRWSQHSPHLPNDERLHRLEMLVRAEEALDNDNWEAGRSAEDRRCFDALAAKAKRLPLDDKIIGWILANERPGPRGGLFNRSKGGWKYELERGARARAAVDNSKQPEPAPRSFAEAVARSGLSL